MYTIEELLAYRCPRWETWPNLDLYMDQAVSLIERHVNLFYTEGQIKPVTPTMINNYVKQRIVPSSRKKKYGRDHLAYFYIVFLLKSALNMADVSDIAGFFGGFESHETAFGIFCEEIEAGLSLAFGGPANNGRGNAPVPGNSVFRAAALAFAYTLLARFQIAADRRA